MSALQRKVELVAGMAKGILETFYGYTFADTITMRSIDEEGGRIIEIPNTVKVVPNPFNDLVRFEFSHGTYDLQIFNLMGALVDQLYCQNCDQLIWKSDQSPAGLYGYKLVSPAHSESGLILKLNP